MKTLLTTVALVGAMTSSAQALDTITPAPTPDLHLAGQHLEKAGKQRNEALVIGLASAAFAGVLLAADSENTGPATAMFAVGLCVSVGLNIGASQNERKAGRVLQGRQP
jgi:hypothetical protein